MLGPQQFRPPLLRALLGLSLGLAACRSKPVERDQEPAPSSTSRGPEANAPTELDNEGFRREVITFVRKASQGGPSEAELACPLPPITKPLHVVVSIYFEGKIRGRGRSKQAELCPALREATRGAVEFAGLSPAQLTHARFAVELSNHDYALIEHQGAGVELVKGQVPVRTLDKAALAQRIDEGAAYLQRVMDPQLGGVHKHYRAPEDAFDDKLHTIYTASTLYTLLAVYDHNHDKKLREPIERGAEFLLSMQRIAPGQPVHGAFHYSFDLTRQEPEPLFVVGTTSKSIFTLIELHELSKDPKYLDAARLAGDWLLTMQAEDGSVTAKLSLDEDLQWSESEQESTLYTGQVLSALSRLYGATSDNRYLDAASRTAAYLVAKQAQEGCYVGDDYRDPNPISSSWMILSLFDFARASDDAEIRELAFACADELLKRQIDDPNDVLRHGRWSGSLSSSGNGWLAEVMATLYLACPQGDPDHCARYRDACIRLFRLLSQYTFSPENSFVARNPAMAKGGVFWNTLERDVRTDSVCHAMNAYVFMIDHLPDGTLIQMPEPDLSRIQPPADAP